MNILKWFRRTKPAPAPLFSDHDYLVIAAHGLSTLDWADMTWERRAHYRRTLAQAPHLEDVL